VENAKLVALIEAASEGSEYLDYAVQRGFGLMKPVPAYTRSVDAALDLMPAGWSVHRLTRRNDCRGNFTGWSAELYRASDVVLEPAAASGATAALALAAAALRARHDVAEGPETASTAMHSANARPVFARL
jgi:hypothetical protein